VPEHSAGRAAVGGNGAHSDNQILKDRSLFLNFADCLGHARLIRRG
jgi:hypothetical protein